MPKGWSVLRKIYKGERAIEGAFFDIYKRAIAKKRVAGSEEILKRNIDFKDKYKGNRCFIIGNGPSLKELDLSLLSNEYTFTVNQLPKSSQFESIRSNFHFWSDVRFFDIDANNSGDLALIETMKKVNTNSNKPCVFYELRAKEMVEKYQLDKILDIHYFSAIQFTKERYLKKDKIDFTKTVCNWPTVIQIVITAAIYMGFTEIYLLGLDCTGFINIAETKMKDYSNGIKYAFDVTEDDKKRMERSNSIYSMRQELLCQAEIFEDYELLNSYAKRKNIRIYNATPGGLLEAFARVNYLDVVGK